jgi:hypothetical protein
MTIPAIGEDTASSLIAALSVRPLLTIVDHGSTIGGMAGIAGIGGNCLFDWP